MFILLLLLMINPLFAREIQYKVYGNVTNASYNIPVINHEVYISVDSSMGAIPYYNVVLTDSTGFYADTISLPEGFTGILHVSTNDPCSGHMIDKYASLNPANTIIEIDFLVCDSGNICTAAFSAFPLSQNPYTIQFLDESTGNPNIWFWDFGDGTSSTEQNPLHRFSDSSMYYICLSIANDSTGCQDIVCDSVYAGEIPCIALFTYSAIPANPLKIQFIDLSTGDINFLEWQFGDGTASNEINPIHIYASPGIYRVCLTVQNTDSLSNCFDVFCDSVFVSDTILCSASFKIALDTTSNIPYRYFFLDRSAGTPDSWYWDFGDGTTSIKQNPIHEYQEEGTYTVCLIIMNNFYPVCYDSTCKVVTTKNYFNLGGFAFSGDNPINNPVSTSDTGIIYLYRVYSGNKILALDTNTFYEYGYYWFTNILEGNYIVKIKLTSNSLHYNDFLPTYHLGHSHWQDALIIPMHDSNSFHVHTHLIPLPGSNPGIGTISGYVVRNFEDQVEGNDISSGTEIILMDDTGQPLDFSFADTNGYFIFSNIELGKYTLYAEATGMYTIPVLVTLSQTTPVIDTITLNLYDHYVIGTVEYPYIQHLKVGNIYPNPVKDLIQFELEIIKPQALSISVIDIYGRELIKSISTYQGGKHLITIHSDQLSGGLYILSIKTQDGKIVVYKKFVK